MKAEPKDGRRFIWKNGILPAALSLGFFLILLCSWIAGGQIVIPVRGHPVFARYDDNPMLFYVFCGMFLFVALLVSALIFALRSTEDK